MTDAALPEMVKVKSSTVDSVGFDAARNEMHVRFKSGGHYVYENVHRDIHGAMLKAKSAGVYHATNVRGVFKSRKL